MINKTNQIIIISYLSGPPCCTRHCILISSPQMNDDDIIIGVKWRMENMENQEELLGLLDTFWS